MPPINFLVVKVGFEPRNTGLVTGVSLGLVRALAIGL